MRKGVSTLEAEATRLRTALEAARLVAEHWRDGGMKMVRDGDSVGALTSHPCACILSALEGETNPVELGVEPDSDVGKALSVLSTPPGEKAE